MRRLGVGVLLIGWFLAPALPAAQAFEGTLKWRLVQVDKDALKRVVGESPEADKVFAIPMEKLMSMHGDAKVTDATVYVKGSKVRAETTAAGGQGYFVMDIDTGVTQVVVPSEKKVLEITKQDVQLMEKRSEAAKGVFKMQRKGTRPGKGGSFERFAEGRGRLGACGGGGAGQDADDQRDADERLRGARRAAGDRRMGDGGPRRRPRGVQAAGAHSRRDEREGHALAQGRADSAGPARAGADARRQTLLSGGPGRGGGEAPVGGALHRARRVQQDLASTDGGKRRERSAALGSGMIGPTVRPHLRLAHRTGGRVSAGGGGFAFPCPASHTTTRAGRSCSTAVCTRRRRSIPRRGSAPAPSSSPATPATCAARWRRCICPRSSSTRPRCCARSTLCARCAIAGARIFYGHDPDFWAGVPQAPALDLTRC